jgi:hypothetical protein
MMLPSLKQAAEVLKTQVFFMKQIQPFKEATTAEMKLLKKFWKAMQS